jgi:hypothetical protein
MPMRVTCNRHAYIYIYILATVGQKIRYGFEKKIIGVGVVPLARYATDFTTACRKLIH